jgi:hypothetical protein
LRAPQRTAGLIILLMVGSHICSHSWQCFTFPASALMKSFFGTLKTECVDRQSFQNRYQARQSIFEYLEAFYNRQRLHSLQGYISPVTYELQAK